MEKYTSRKIDELGRIVLPSQLRKELGWSAGDSVVVYCVDKNTVILQTSEKKQDVKASS